MVAKVSWSGTPSALATDMNLLINSICLKLNVAPSIRACEIEPGLMTFAKLKMVRDTEHDEFCSLPLLLAFSYCSQLPVLHFYLDNFASKRPTPGFSPCLFELLF